MDYTKKSRTELVALCKEKQLKGYSTKKKDELIELLLSATESVTESVPTTEKPIKKQKQQKTDTPSPICRLNYIGSKYQLLEWLEENIKAKVGGNLKDKTIADLFAGTGVVSYYFRTKSAAIQSNDAELYSSIITHAFTKSSYTEQLQGILDTLNGELKEQSHKNTHEYITKNYSPYDTNERQFFTVDNAQRIDYIRARLEELKETLNEDDYKFLLASLLLAADAVSNVPAVYGCYLKKFKSKAEKPLTLKPLHTLTEPANPLSQTFQSDVLSDTFLANIKADITYLDPPYNERQYSKNYFPLNMIALTPAQQLAEQPLKGKTGIPQSCFMSPFCKKGKPVEEAFQKLFSKLQTEWVFLSYNSESLITKDRMLELMKPYGEASVIERDYKRFKSFEYNKDVEIKEYLFCLHKKPLQKPEQKPEQTKRKRPQIAKTINNKQ